jgi:hypothetical protein
VKTIPARSSNAFATAGSIQTDDGIKYFSPSSLHRWYVEWKLWDVASASASADATSDSFESADILDFVINIISTFSPARVSDSTPRRDADIDTDIIGPGRVRRPPNARYQVRVMGHGRASTEDSGRK